MMNVDSTMTSSQRIYTPKAGGPCMADIAPKKKKHSDTPSAASARPQERTYEAGRRMATSTRACPAIKHASQETVLVGYGCGGGMCLTYCK